MMNLADAKVIGHEIHTLILYNKDRNHSRTYCVYMFISAIISLYCLSISLLKCGKFGIIKHLNVLFCHVYIIIVFKAMGD